MSEPSTATALRAPADPPDLFCTGNERFTGGVEVKRYRVQGEIIDLQHHPDVFPPSAFGLRLAEHLDFRHCRRAIDIGTGTGLFAILAARKGVGDVTATDLSDLAVSVATHNAHVLNRYATIRVRQGAFFADAPGDFDVIVANLPQEILPPGYRGTLTGRQQGAIDGGGPGGNGILLDFLDRAPARMQPHTRLYTFVDTLTDFAETLRKIDRTFTSRLLWEGLTATKAFVRDHIAFFKALDDAGTIAIVQDQHGLWRARQMIFELRLR